jgi:hypothetical protein
MAAVADQGTCNRRMTRFLVELIFFDTFSLREPLSASGSSPRACSLENALMCDPPDRPVPVFGHQQRARRGDCSRQRAGPPDLGIVDDKAGHKIVVLTGGNSVLEPKISERLCSRALRPVP